jgi:hypothetical protein
MDLNRVVAQLRADLANLNAAIASLERLPSSEKRTRRSPHLVRVKAAAPRAPALRPPPLPEGKREQRAEGD